ncbi:MAG: glycoside hydrolase family 127 protein [Clostridia bacterium]|nr:glycoside hydrolase family 127 protein [Clostridia bacterium]
MKNICFENIKINDGFWKVKQDMVKNSTLYAVYNRFVDTHRFDAFSCTWKEGEPDMPHIFWDSDVAKWIEGASYLLMEQRDERIEAIIDDVVDKIVSNSDENGYFNSHFLVTEKDKRFKIRDNHELYCAGHLMEAAVAYNKATGKDKFLKAMCRFADYIYKVFREEKSAEFVTPGHPEIELALVRLYDATGEKRYLELSKFFIDEHGTGKDDPDNRGDFANILYNQDDVPLRERSTAEGHAVRALYLYCGMADIAARCNDSELLEACKRVFEDMANKKMYISGGLGSTYLGEAFTVPYHLPNRTAYTETCAAIAMALFCKRMQQLDIDSKYADVAERVIYNGFLSGVSMDGKSFFYENPLEIDPKFNDVNNSTKTKERFPITQRVEVFECSCCPPNIVRFIPSIADLMYSFDDETVYIHQYIDSETEYDNIHISQTTAYPADGKIKIRCSAPQKQIALRIPSWCSDFKINADYTVKNGYAYIALDGISEIELELSMPVVCVKSNKRVHENAGRIAVMRGPVLYCAEGVDNGEDLAGIAVDISSEFKQEENDFILPSLSVCAYREKDSDMLYSKAGDDYEKFTLKLIPYYAFANRGETEMTVWFLRK